MEYVLLAVALTAVLTISHTMCFLVAVRACQKVQKGEEVTLPKPDVLETVRQARAEKESRRAADRTAVLMANIEAYDGTGNGQMDIPGR